MVAASSLITISSGAQSSSPSAQAAEWIVFSSTRSGSGDVYAVHPKGGEVIPVALTASPEGSPRLDVANNRIVHQRYENGRTLLVSGDDDLFPDPAAENAPTWSPDGWWIAYSAVRGGREDLYIARPDGSVRRQLTDDREIDRYPSWSPDGTRILFARKEAAGWVVCSLDLRDLEAGPGRLTAAAEYVGHPVWSPDGKKIAFDTLFDGQTEIAMLDLESGDVTRLTNRPGNDLVPAWSSDSGTLAFGGQPDSTLNWDVWTVDVKTLELTRVTTNPAFDGGPVFVPAAAMRNRR